VQTVRVAGASLVGIGADLVTVEARFESRDREQTEVVLTGLPDTVTRESRGKLLSALTETGIRLGPGRLHLNLVPAARRKSGEILDLPLALATAAAAGWVDPHLLDGALFLGELGIDGQLHAVPGGLAAALAAREAGLGRVFAPGVLPEGARGIRCAPPAGSPADRLWK
jgi:magnesium chelatase family protein